MLNTPTQSDNCNYTMWIKNTKNDFFSQFMGIHKRRMTVNALIASKFGYGPSFDVDVPQ